MKTLYPPYDPNSACPKCGFNEATTAWISIAMDNETDFIARECSRCQYVRRERPIDANDPAATFEVVGRHIERNFAPKQGVESEPPSDEALQIERLKAEVACKEAVINQYRRALGEIFDTALEDDPNLASYPAKLARLRALAVEALKIH